MSRVAVLFAILLAVLAAAAAALIVVPAPSKMLAFVAIAAGEKSMFIAAAAVAGAVVGLFAMRPGTRLLACLAVLLCLGALVLSLVPFAQALRVASEQRVDLDFHRYLSSPIDTEGPIKARKTISYATVEGKKLSMDVYAPAAASGAGAAARAIVVAHGGGWSAGDKGDASLASQWFADHGFVVFDVEYRTAPQPNWKSAVGDFKCAIAWIKGHAATADWNVDPDKVTLLGRSAGGHLALLAAYAPEDPRLPPTCAGQAGVARDTTVESVVSFYAPTDLTWGYAHPARPAVYDSSEKLRQFIGGPPESTGDLYRMLSPTERATATAPRTLMIHGGRDQFIGRQHVDMLADKLHALAVPYDTLIIPYAQHGFDFVFGGLSGQIAEAVVLRFLNAPARVKPATPADDTGDKPDPAVGGTAPAEGGAAGGAAAESTAASHSDDGGAPTRR